eukprot:2927805-Amphidinium_carterae.2
MPSIRASGMPQEDVNPRKPDPIQAHRGALSEGFNMGKILHRRSATDILSKDKNAHTHWQERELKDELIVLLVVAVRSLEAKLWGGVSNRRAHSRAFEHLPTPMRYAGMQHSIECASAGLCHQKFEARTT